jgi:probable HAF family extracellular repeat protein
MHHRTLVGIVICVACLLGLVQPAGAVVQYTVTDLTGGGGYANAINSSGQIAGTLSLPISQAFLWSDGVLTGMPGLGGSSYGYAVNEAGGVAGASYDTYARKHAVVWNSGVLQDLRDTGGAGLTAATGINGTGQVTVIGLTGGYVWNGGTLTPVGIESPYAINDSGEVVGGKRTGQVDGNGLPLNVPALWDHGTLTLLDSVGGVSSGGTAINDLGQVVGNTVRKGVAAFLWENGVTQILPVPSASSSYATDINNAGQAVGWMTLSGESTNHAFLYSDGAVVDLNNLIAPGSGWVVDRAYGINDAGQIVGIGAFSGVYRAVLLTPVPEPTTLLLLLAVHVGWSRWRRRA